MFERICFLGLGYIGLPTATLFAARGKEVVGVDTNPAVVETVNQGKIHIVEPELDILVRAVVKEGKLRATLNPEAADAFLVAVPTPFKGDHEPDLKYIESAAQMIAPVLVPGNLVVLESTSPVGTTEQMAAWLAKARPDLSFPQQAGDSADIQVAYCPERVLPGKVVHELVSNDRVIGGMTQKASEMAVALYKIFVDGECIVTNARTAEMCKLTENSSRDVSIAFANELSIICAKFEIDVWELIALANRHPRVNILQPGAGVGGHCIAVDPWFIVHRSPEHAQLIRTARNVNTNKPLWVVEQVKACLTELLTVQPTQDLSSLKVACLGLAFKPNIDDLRESPAVTIAQNIANLGCEVLGVEPHIQSLPSNLENSGIVLTSSKTALSTADVVCILVRHKAFEEWIPIIRSRSCVIDAVGILT